MFTRLITRSTRSSFGYPVCGIRCYANKPFKSKPWKTSRKNRSKEEYNVLKERKQFPEDPRTLENKITKVKEKYQDSEEFQGVTIETMNPNILEEIKKKEFNLTIEEQSSLLKTLLKRGNIEDIKVAEQFEGPIRKLLNPEMYEIFKKSYIPYDISPKKIELAEKFFSTANPQFKHLAASLEQLEPPKKLHQISFAGRSNVGKSSLLNKLLGDKKLVRVSANPGFTKSINYYELGGTELESRSIYLVDMPGYGFAKAAKSSIKQFQQLVVDFLNQPVTYQHRCFVLIDAKIGIGQLDREMMNYLEDSKVSYQVILTKADKISADELQKQLLDTQQYLRRKGVSSGHPWIIPTSAKSGLGISELKGCICIATGIVPVE